MTNKKTTRRALVTSIISLLLCLSMLVGTTFAWFTDSVTSGKNTIVAGNLDVELDYWNGSEWVAVDENTNLFAEDALWEPGYTEVVYLRVSNAGTLALKYKLGINVVSETTATNVDGETFKLSDYIEYGAIEGINGETGAYATREDARKAVTTGTKIAAGYTKGEASLTEKDADYLALVVYMPESVGNEANYRGDVVPQITLGLNLFAAQLAYESDSFDNTYDKNATYGEPWDGSIDTELTVEGNTVYITSPAELAGFAANVNAGNSYAGYTVELTGDMNMNNLPWTPIGQTGGYSAETYFQGTFDGKDNTIANLNVTVHEMGNDGGMNYASGLFGFVDAASATIQNVNFENANVVGHHWVGVVAGYMSGTIANCSVNDSSVTATHANDDADGDKVGAITGFLNKGALLNNTVTNTTIYGNRDIGGIVGSVTTGQTMTNNTVADVVIFYVTEKTDYASAGEIVSGRTGFVADESNTATNCIILQAGETLTVAEGETLTVRGTIPALTVAGTGTLVLDGVTINATEGNALTLKSSTKIVVEDNTSLTGAKNGSGIYVADGEKLTITGDGSLNTVGNSGTEYEASGNYCESTDASFNGAGGSGIRGGEGSTITIKGLSSLTAEGYGKNGFGIGGNGATVTIEDTTIEYVRGGFVNVTGKYNDTSYNKSEPEGGAAIGGEKITIENCWIKEALGGSKAAGIGARFWQPTDITITDSVIDKVVGGASSAGIGGSRVDDADINQDVTITIEDSTITAQGGYFGAGIGSGYDTHCQTPDKAPMHTIYIKGDSTINATGGKYAAGIGTGYHVAGLSGEIEETVTVNATAGESREKYTVAMDVGFGVIDHGREANDDNKSSFKYKGTDITVKDAPLVQ